MSAEKDFNQISYEKHVRNYCNYAIGGEKENLSKTWFSETTVNDWLHKRMYRCLDALIDSFPDANWLTIGDGRYGCDAYYIQQKGLNVLATDIAEVLLKEGKENGYIKEYKIENAESLSFADRSFDFVLCKEAYHHFPRPMIALYEMLRVAKKGVVLIEPNDSYGSLCISHLFFQTLKDTFKRILGREVHKNTFEEVGNYAYTISQREIEKVALGMNFQTVAFQGMHTYYIKGVEYENVSARGPLFKKIKQRISLYDLLSTLGLQSYGLLIAIIFKETISPELLRILTKNGYNVVSLPTNPYIQK